MIRYEFYRDRDVAFEGFTGKNYTFREEFTSRIWATRYDFPAMRDGRVKRDVLKDETPSGAQGWFLNTRRQKFRDVKLREALIYAFDFEWTNRTIMYGSYDRTHSVFQNSDLMATGKPGDDELKLLERFRGKVPDEVFGEPFVPPVTDGSGNDRALLRHATRLLNEAGYPIKNGKRVMPNGERLTIEFLLEEPSFQAHHMPYIKNLAVLGIDANIRMVDPVQLEVAHQRLRLRCGDSALRLLDGPRRVAALILLLALRDAERLAESRRHFRPRDRRAGRHHRRRTDPAGTRDGLPRARPRDPFRPLLGSALVQGLALDRLLGHVRPPLSGQAEIWPRYSGDMVVRSRQGGATGTAGLAATASPSPA